MAALFNTPDRKRPRLGPFSAPRTKKARLGPYSRPHTLTLIDGRCQVARCIRDLAQELVRHVGGDPTPAQLLLIREAAIKNAKLGMLVDKILQDAEPDVDLATRCYLAWSNSLRRDLEALGIRQPEKVVQRLADVIRPKTIT